MNVSAVIPTRGNVDTQPIIDSLPSDWEIVIYDNGAEMLTKSYPDEPGCFQDIYPLPDLSVYARYAAISEASHDLIYVQDDDVIVSDPQAIVDAWVALATCDGPRDCVGTERGCVHCYPTIQESVVCNMPQEFRPHYPDSALVGFGAAFHRAAPARAFERFHEAPNVDPSLTWEQFYRECDRVFTCLTPRVLVDVPKQDLPYFDDPDRLWKQAEHNGSTKRMLDLARQVRDA